MDAPTPKARCFWPFLLILFVTDCSTKDLVVDHLSESTGPQPIVDGFVRLTLAHNAGTAFGFDLRPYIGDWTHPLLITGMSLVLLLLFRLYGHTAPRARLAATALGLAAGGAIGNLFDRLRFHAGVVDFIDVGIAAHRFWVFNVADAGITIGALLLAFTFLRNELETSTPRPAVER
jgi:signal peptidase II